MPSSRSFCSFWRRSCSYGLACGCSCMLSQVESLTMIDVDVMNAKVMKKERMEDGRWRMANSQLRVFAILYLLSSILAPSPAHATGDMRVLRTKYYRIHTDLDADLAEDL